MPENLLPILADSIAPLSGLFRSRPRNPRFFPDHSRFVPKNRTDLLPQPACVDSGCLANQPV